MKNLCLMILFLAAAFLSPAQSYYNKEGIEDLPGAIKKAYRRTNRFLDDATKGEYLYRPPARSRIDTIFLSGDTLHILFKDEFGYKPIRTPQAEDTEKQLERKLHGIGRRHIINISVKGYALNRLVPNAFLENKDPLRLALNPARQTAHVQNISKPYPITAGLNNRHLALWSSHGWYYQNKADRWAWQRATVFTTVEDLLTTSFVLPFLVPMLENAGANVYLPRERDTQIHEVIVDNRDASYREYQHEPVFSTAGGQGYGHIEKPLQTGQNPFLQGDFRVLPVRSGPGNKARWTPFIPDDGEYAVYVAYQTLDNSSDEAQYEVRHSGGLTRFTVNQQIGSGTWVYLGTFRFRKGQNDTTGSVTLTTEGEAGKVVTADAVRFGGGMGDVARNGKISNRPRWIEAARYYLQYAGFPDTLVFNQQKDQNDYVDDYRSRGRWVNYLRGGKYMEPWITKGQEIKGLGVPVDLSMAFHTDAGHHYGTDTMVGTLTIYSSRDAEFNRQFPDGEDRLTNRDFADLLSAQITDDIRTLVNPGWPQRELWDQRYSEATYPTVPSALLELLSHQNLADMRYALDPAFRFLVSRSVYKSILKFLAGYNQIPYKVQPLPVDHLYAELNDRKVRLAWRPVRDPLEPTASPEQYVVYTRKEDQGWDNGTLTSLAEYLSPELEKGSIYSFKVTAVNEGGESFPSNVLSVCYNGDHAETVVVIDAFDRVSAPLVVNEGNFTGFAGWLDEGVAWGNDLLTIGREYEFNQLKPWKDDDDPGHGASYDDLAGKLSAGNSFDHVYSHGQAIRDAGFSFVSCSRLAAEDGDFSLNGYRMADLIFGEEKTTLSPTGISHYTLYTPAMRHMLGSFLRSGSGLFISGAYVGSDPFFRDKHEITEEEKEFVENVLGYTCRTGHASAIPLVKATDNSPIPAFDGRFGFNTDYRTDLYRVEAPDAVIPADSTATTILRYVGNNKSAGVLSTKAYKVLTVGFPFETITTAGQRSAVMKQILEELTGKKSGR